MCCLVELLKASPPRSPLRSWPVSGPVGPVEVARKQLAGDLVAEIRDADRRLKALTTQIAQLVAATGSRLMEVDGVGPVVSGRLLARTHRMSRFATAAAF